MEIFFGRRELQALCNSRDALVRRWGDERAGLVAQRLHELAAVDCLADVDLLPHVGLHRRGSSIHVSVDEDLRISLVAADGRRSLTRSNLTVVTEIVIDDILDEGETA